MTLPKLRVQPLKPYFNTRLICNYLSPEKTKNKTRPFAEKTYLMYPELRGKLDGLSDEEKTKIIKEAVEKRLSEASEEIKERCTYFQEKFDTFIYDFIYSQCYLYNYQWKDIHPYIDCYVGYIPFYPRSVKSKWFYVSYNDEERVFSGAVHEINHMICYEKWKEIKRSDDLPEPGFQSPLWFLEEIIVDPTLNDKSVKPYTLFKNRAYEQFYVQKINGLSIMEYIYEIYDNSKCIERFMLNAYDFIDKNIENIK